MDTTDQDPQALVAQSYQNVLRKKLADGATLLSSWARNTVLPDAWKAPNQAPAQAPKADPRVIASGDPTGEAWVDRARQVIRDREDFRPVRYDDGKGNATVGYGMNLNRPGAAEFVKEVLGFSDADFNAVRNGTKALTRDQGEKLLRADTDVLAHALDDRLAGKVRDHHKIALLSIGFNTGLTGLMRSDLMKRIEGGDLEGAAALIPDFRVGPKTDRTHRGLKTRRQIELAYFKGAD